MDFERGVVNTFDTTGWTAEVALERKGSTTISVCIPCRNEASTVGSIVNAIREALVDAVPLVDEVLVLDDRSADGTAEVAHAAGATVVRVDDVHPNLGRGHGKGNVLWATVAASKGDLVVWCDGDITSFTPDWIVHLVAPLLDDPAVALVKGFYERPVDEAGRGGGRTTELAARPMLSMLYPALADLFQPLGGEAAARRTVLEDVPFMQGWGVEVGLLVEVLEAYGAAAISQVDLGVRRHRHRPLGDLSLQASEILLTLMLRSGRVQLGDIDCRLHCAGGTSVELNVDVRPALSSIEIDER